MGTVAVGPNGRRRLLDLGGSLPGSGTDVAPLHSFSRLRPAKGEILPHEPSPSRGGEETMQWETPECIEIKMDAELSSYQEG